MPGISRGLLLLGWLALEAQRVDALNQRNHNKDISPTAIGFLVPLFLVFLVGPFMCVFFVRRRRRSDGEPYGMKLQTPVERREDARRKLDGVTEVSKLTGDAKSTCTTDSEDKGGCAETLSVLERECAICLSTLHAPSPPEPVKIAEAGSKPPSSSNVSIFKKEEILRLKVCGHEFHAECLISWFHIRKCSCPICRAVYYKRKTEQSEGNQEREMEEGRAVENQEPMGDSERRGRDGV